VTSCEVPRNGIRKI